MTHKLLLMFFLLVAGFAVQAQSTRKWNGSVSTNWNTAANWTPAVVPVAGDSLHINNLPSQYQPVIFSGTMAKAKNIYVGYNNILTINSGGELELASTLNVTAMEIGGGTVINNGTLKVKSGFEGIDNFGTFINNATILIGVAGASPYSIGEEGIRVGGPGYNFTNNSTGEITILRTANNGILLNSSGATLTNYGMIIVRETGLSADTAVAATGDGIDARGGTFINETTGEVFVTKTSANGLNCRNSGGSMTNKGLITIQNVGLTLQNELREGINILSATFDNTATGQIIIDTTGNNGFVNQGIAYNSGTLTIRNVFNGVVNLAGMFNEFGATMEISDIEQTGIFTGGFGGVLTNEGTISIDEVGQDGIHILGFGGFDNRNILHIGANGDIGQHGINNGTSFVNQFTGAITVNRTAGTAVNNYQSPEGHFIKPVFINAGQLTIGDPGDASSGIAGIANTVPARFDNRLCAVLTTYQAIVSADSFLNEAFIYTRSTLPNTISGAFINNGVIHDPNGGFDGQPLTNNDFIISAAAGECVIADALQKGAGTNVTIANTWYKDQALTMTAGTYNQAANTFTVTNLSEGTHTLYFRATDNANLCSTVVPISVTYDDVTPPAITCPDDATVSCAGLAPAANIGAVTATDNCGTPVKSHVNDAISDQTCPNRYTVTRTYQANDNRGNTNTCEQVITVNDLTPPVFAGIPTDATVQCDAVPPPASPTASDNCGGSIPVDFNQTRTDGDCLNRYTLTRTWTSTDLCGNVNETTQIITVIDTQAPTFAGIPNDVTVQCHAVPPPASPTATDNCTGSVLISYNQTRTNGNCPDTYTLTRVWTATDICGNSRAESQVVTVRDTQAPTFTSVPANVTVQCNSLPAVGTATATDNCDGSVSITYTGQTRTNGNCTDTYILTRLWTAVDNCGNTKTATQRISVLDTQKPNFTSTPANITVQCHAIPDPASPTATDTCDDSVAVTYNGQTVTAGACANTYTLTRRWTAADNCGNTRTFSQRINVVDNGKPTFTYLPENTTIACDATPPAVGAPTASDGCGGNVTIAYLGQTTASGSCPGSYQMRRTWRATDACGNSTIATQTIQVQDTDGPEFTTVPGPLTIGCNQSLPVLVHPTASDACGYAYVTFLGQVASGSGCAADYTVTRTWQATDLCGNTETTAQVITVHGNNFGMQGAENREGDAQLKTQNAELKTLNLQPNPTNDRVWIDLTDFVGEAVTASVFSDKGQLVWERSIPIVEDQRISVGLREAGAAAGIYTVRVYSVSGVVAKRLVLVD